MSWRSPTAPTTSSGKLPAATSPAADGWSWGGRRRPGSSPRHGRTWNGTVAGRAERFQRNRLVGPALGLDPRAIGRAHHREWILWVADLTALGDASPRGRTLKMSTTLPPTSASEICRTMAELKGRASLQTRPVLRGACGSATATRRPGLVVVLAREPAGSGPTGVESARLPSAPASVKTRATRAVTRASELLGLVAMVMPWLLLGDGLAGTAAAPESRRPRCRWRSGGGLMLDGRAAHGA